MTGKATINNTMRIWHRYLGFFLVGIMAVYAISGVVMIFRDTDFLKRDQQVTKKLASQLNAADLGKALRMNDLKVDHQNGDSMFFRGGYYISSTGDATYTIKTLPSFIQKLTQLHKASTKQPLFYLNVFFGVSLLFFVVSSFWMFLPKTSIFKRGLYFTAAGVILTLILLFI